MTVLITTQPQDTTVEEGVPAFFDVVAEGTGTLTYQWYITTTGAISGATSNALAIGGVSMSKDGNQYYVLVTDDDGTVQSDNATLTVTASTDCPGYACDAVETTLLGISNIASAWRWLDLNEVGVNDRISQEELTGLGANQAATGGPGSLYPNPIDYCLPAENALATTPGGTAGQGAFHANTILGNSEFWEDHTFHAWIVMNFTSSTALPVYALLNHQGSQEYVRLYIINSTGELRFHFFDLVIGNHNSVSLGNVMTPFASGGEGKWVSLYSHFAVTPTGMAGWVEVDGVRTEVIDNTVNVKVTNSGDPRAALLNDEVGRATPGLATIYPSFFTGEVSASDITLLDDAWDRNISTYIDPNPLCIPS